MSVQFDSGFKGQVSLDRQVLETICEKQFVKEEMLYGVLGKCYNHKIFTVPSIKIGGVSFSDPLVHEINQQLHQDGFLTKSSSARSVSGMIGWEMFRSVNLLIDFPRSRIGMCDGIQTLRKNGYDKHQFIKVPLLEDKPYIGFQAETPEGLLNCCLDTGATLNFFETGEKGELVELENFKVGGHDFGAIQFYSFPTNMPDSSDATLGSIFFSRHVVFVDFKERCAYISY